MKLNQWTVTFIGTCVVGLLSGTNSWRPDKPGTEWPPDLPSWPKGKPKPRWDREGIPALDEWKVRHECYFCSTRIDGPDCLSTDRAVLEKFKRVCTNSIYEIRTFYCITWSNSTGSSDDPFDRDCLMRLDEDLLRFRWQYYVGVIFPYGTRDRSSTWRDQPQKISQAMVHVCQTPLCNVLPHLPYSAEFNFTNNETIDCFVHHQGDNCPYKPTTMKTTTTSTSTTTTTTPITTTLTTTTPTTKLTTTSTTKHTITTTTTKRVMTTEEPTAGELLTTTLTTTPKDPKLPTVFPPQASIAGQNTSSTGVRECFQPFDIFLTFIFIVVY